MSSSALARKTTDSEIAFDEVAAINTAVNGASIAIMMVDRDFNITYFNQSTKDLLAKNGELFRRTFPAMDFSNLMGVCIDGFHKNPAHQRQLMSAPRDKPHRAEIGVGDLRFMLNISSVVNEAGDYVGNVLEWNDVTEERKQRDLLAVVDKALAVVEFGMDGIIQDANPNFLNTLGYTLGEVRGQPHSMFVDPEYRQSADYKAFWDKLNRGESDSGQYKRIAKGGKEVWIEASYTPVVDLSGKPVKVVQCSTDITEQKIATADFEGQIAAIGKSQAVISFSLDGKVLDANQNFLDCTGYSLAEIRGQHHSMFVDATYRTSPEYRAFWDRLNRGEFESSKYQRVGKGGKDIWLQASYNPILDLNGKPFKVVKYATDITEQRKAAERVQEISNIVSSAATEMRATAEQLSKTAQEATQQATAVASGAQVASTNVQTVSAAGEELSASISEIARQVAESTNITQHAVAETEKTSIAIKSLADAAQKIGNVVTLINNIAGQTKLLALNATIEAARAGDAGKGFAVVASEVKSLSDQTAKATHEISSEVSAMQAATAASVGAIQGIAETIARVAEIASAIASAVEEQSAATGEISANVVEAAQSTQEVTTNIKGLSEGVSQTGEAAAELLRASDELAVQAEALNGQMDLLLR